MIFKSTPLSKTLFYPLLSLYSLLLFNSFLTRPFLLHVKMFITPFFLKLYSLSHATPYALVLLLFFCFFSLFFGGSVFNSLFKCKYSHGSILNFTVQTRLNVPPDFTAHLYAYDLSVQLLDSYIQKAAVAPPGCLRAIPNPPKLSK